MDFSKLQVQTRPNARKPISFVDTPQHTINQVKRVEEIATIIKKKALIIQDPSLAYYKKIYQYCEGCKTETVFDVIGDKGSCKFMFGHKIF